MNICSVQGRFIEMVEGWRQRTHFMIGNNISAQWYMRHNKEPYAQLHSNEVFAKRDVLFNKENSIPQSFKWMRCLRVCCRVMRHHIRGWRYVHKTWSRRSAWGLCIPKTASVRVRHHCLQCIQEYADHTWAVFALMRRYASLAHRNTADDVTSDTEDCWENESTSNNKRRISLLNFASPLWRDGLVA